MTSRVSFPKLVAETLRRHMAAVLITVLVFFIHIVSFFLNVQNIFNTHYPADSAVTEWISGVKADSIPVDQLEYMLEDFVALCSPDFANTLLAMALAVYFAFDFFRYMHSKRETDFYASMPVKRQTWFMALFVSSFGIFTVLAAVTIGIEIAIAFSTGYGSLIIFQNMLWSLLCMLGIFLATWATTVLAMIMTGHSLVACLATVVFAAYVPLILNYLVPVYAGTFFETYVFENPGNWAYYFSPATLGYKLTSSWREWTFSEHWTYFVGVWVFALIIGVLAYLLFLKRPSETAGRAMAFEKANTPIRILLVIPLALYAGIFLNEMASFAGIVWLFFGVIFGCILLHAIIEAIFQFDVRAIASKKKQLLFEILFSLIFVAVFIFDLCKYDAYIPDSEKVKTVQISSWLLEQEENDADEKEKKNWLQGESVEKALNVAKDIRNLMDQTSDNDYYRETITFTYTLNNGRTIKRRYWFDASMAPDSLNELYTTEDFKDDYCLLYNIDPGRIYSMHIDNGLTSQALQLSDSELEEFIHIFLKEHTKLTFDDVFSNTILFRLQIDYGSDQEAKGSYYIYPSFTETLTFLERKGIRYFGETMDVTLENLHLYGGKFANTEEFYVEDAETLKELQPFMIPTEFVRYDYDEEYNYGELRFKQNGQTSYLNVYIKQADLESILD